MCFYSMYTFFAGGRATITASYVNAQQLCNWHTGQVAVGQVADGEVHTAGYAHECLTIG